MITQIFFLFILLFGTITSYGDIREGKIKNKHIIYAFIFAVFINSLMFFGFFTDPSIGKDYYTTLLINVVVSLLLGFTLWMFGVWTPGDAKLFSAYAALVPLTTYSIGYIPLFPSFTLLSNTFIPLFFFMLLTIPFSIKRSDKTIKDLFDPKKLLDRILFLFGFLWFFDIIFSFLGMQITFLMYLLLFMTIPYLFKKINFISLTHASIMLSILRVLFDYNTVFTPGFLKFFIYLTLIFTIVMFTISLSGFLTTATTLNIHDLKPGMILNEKIESNGKLITHTNRGLTADDIKLINKLYAGKGTDQLHIQQTLPFAPLMFFGVLLTYLCTGDLISLFHP